MNHTPQVLAGVAALALLIVSSCSDDASPTAETQPTTAITTAPSASLITDLCAVLNAASGDEIGVARETFDHGPLHTLADEVTDIDRSVAAELLEAKEAVEADLAETAPDAVVLVDDLEALVTATANALGATGVPAPKTCDPENP